MRLPILALLATSPAHGYELKAAVSGAFGPLLPPLNPGQVYTTLQRLERDGLVAGERVEQSDRPNKRVFSITADGRAELERWAREPTPSAHVKDDFAMKLVLSLLTGLIDPQELIARQRTEYLRALRDLDDLQDSLADGEAKLAAELLLEGGALRLQADLRWLDRCEQRLGEQVGG